MLFFMGNNLAGAIFGPPAIWDRPWSTPIHEDLVGNYSESSRNLDREIGQAPATLTLGADGSMTVKNLPYEEAEAVCVLSGRGKWNGPNGSGDVWLNVNSDGLTGSCGSDSYSFIELAGHSKPYTLYWVVGDPDSGTGVWLRRN
jgi:hypothetical protein